MNTSTIIENGILLAKNDQVRSEYQYSDLEIKRRFEWGEVRSVWNNEKTNIVLENEITRIEEVLERYLTSKQPNANSMLFDFSQTLEDLKHNIYGEMRN